MSGGNSFLQRRRGCTRVIVANWIRRELRDSHVLAPAKRCDGVSLFRAFTARETSRVVQSYSRGSASPVRDSS